MNKKKIKLIHTEFIRPSFYTLYREFSNERTRVERQATYYKMRTKKKYIDMFNTYIKWITTAGIYRVLNARVMLSSHLTLHNRVPCNIPIYTYVYV